MNVEVIDVQESCDTCVFALFIGEQQSPNSEAVVRTGFCRRYPPQMLAVLQPVERPSKMVGGAPQVVGMQTIVQPTFATTHSEQWCGEYASAFAVAEND